MRGTLVKIVQGMTAVRLKSLYSGFVFHNAHKIFCLAENAPKLISLESDVGELYVFFKSGICENWGRMPPFSKKNIIPIVKKSFQLPQIC